MVTGRELDSTKFQSPKFDVSMFNEMKDLMKVTIKTIPTNKGNVVMMAKIEDRLNPPPIVNEPEIAKEPSKSGMSNEEILQVVIDTVTEITGVPKEQLNIHNRKKDTVTTRKIIIFITRLISGNSLVTIANKFNLDHSTIINSSKKMYEHICSKDKDIYKMYREALFRLDESYKLVPDFSREWYKNLKSGFNKYAPKEYPKKTLAHIRTLSKKLSCSAIGKIYNVDGTTIRRILET